MLHLVVPVGLIFEDTVDHGFVWLVYDFMSGVFPCILFILLYILYVVRRSIMIHAYMKQYVICWYNTKYIYYII